VVITIIYPFLVGADWNHGILNDFPFSWEWKIIPTDELIFFQRGWLNHQPDFVASKTWVVNNHENHG